MKKFPPLLHAVRNSLAAVDSIRRLERQPPFSLPARDLSELPPVGSLLQDGEHRFPNNVGSKNATADQSVGDSRHQAAGGTMIKINPQFKRVTGKCLLNRPLTYVVTKDFFVDDRSGHFSTGAGEFV